ncbi:MAG: hypothetical protein AB8B72_06225 [Crocinitomicaceae bacterium]
MALKKYEIETSYAANGQIIVKVGNPEGDLTYDTPLYQHGHPIGTEAENGGDHIKVYVKSLNPPTNNGDLIFTGIEMFKDPQSEFFEVVSVVQKDPIIVETEKKRKRKTNSMVSSLG